MRKQLLALTFPFSVYALIRRVPLFVSVLYFASPAAASARSCQDLLSSLSAFQRSYIEATGNVKSGWAQKTIQSLSWTKPQPLSLQDVPMKNISWVKKDNRSFAVGDIPWGHVRIFTQVKDSTTLNIDIEQVNGFKNLNMKKLALLQSVYPGLRLVTEGVATTQRSSSEEVVPQTISLRLDKQDIPPGLIYESAVRSLVNTLINDPEGLLGFGVKYPLPLSFAKIGFLQDNIGYFGNYGKWDLRIMSRSPEENYTAIKRDFNSQEIISYIEIDPVRSNMDIFLATEERGSLLPVVRRVAWAMLKVYGPHGTELPSVQLHEIFKGVIIEDLPFQERSKLLAEALDSSANDPRFEKALKGLDMEQQEWVLHWLQGNFQKKHSWLSNKPLFRDIVDGNAG